MASGVGAAELEGAVQINCMDGAVSLVTAAIDSNSQTDDNGCASLIGSTSECKAGKSELQGGASFVPPMPPSTLSTSEDADGVRLYPL